MKVCFIVGTLGRGGAEKQLVFMLRALLRAGIEARILCLTRGESYEAEIKSLGVEIEYIGGRQNRLRRLWAIIKNLRARPVDIIQSSHFYTNIYAGLAGKALGIPSIGAIRSNLKSELAIHRSLGKFQLSLPKFLIVNSELGRRTALENGIAPDRIEFVRNVVEIKGEPQAAAPRGAPLNFLFVGRLGKEKRPDRFVRLAAALAERYPALPLRFLIAGDGVLRHEVEQQAKDRPALAGKLEFLGERTDMDEIYRQAGVHVLTSDYEGTPNVVLEAMAHGLPVIATRVGGTPEILNEKCGILVDPHDEAELLAAAGRLVESRELRESLGAAGFRYIKTNHSLESLIDHLSAIYAQLTRKTPRESSLKSPLAQKISSR